MPRYNEFRTLIHMDPVSDFEHLTDNPEWAEQLRQVYNNDIDSVDTMVGMLAEPLIEGFGFSETAFHIFALMASRRLKSDRFFTDNFDAETYTPAGMQWLSDNTMLTMLRRHHPSLAPALEGVTNAFQPWKRQ